MVNEKKVYVVTAGEYSGYHIKRIFSDAAVAESWADRHNRSSASFYDKAEVEEWDVDSETDPYRDKIAFAVKYTLWPERDVMSGLGRSGWLCTGYPDLRGINHEVVYDEWTTSRGETVRSWQTMVWADTIHEAKKIGADRITSVAAAAIQGDEPFAESQSDRLRAQSERRDTTFLNFIGDDAGEQHPSKWGFRAKPTVGDTPVIDGSNDDPD